MTSRSDRAAEIAGTRVSMRRDNDSARTLRSVFDAFADPEEYTFDRTVVPVRLAQHEGERLVNAGVWYRCQGMNG